MTQLLFELLCSVGARQFLLTCFFLFFSKHLLVLTWICVTVCRSPGGAEASLCSHGELGPECVCGAEDLVGS